MSLPHEEVFEFYEGEDRALYTDATGINFNKAPQQLLENDLALQSQIDDLIYYRNVVTDEQSGELPKGALWMIDTSSVSPETLLNNWAEEQTQQDEPEYNPYNARKYGATCYFDSKHWILGGDASGGTLGEIWSSPNGYDWTLETSSAPFGNRIGHKVIVMGSYIYLIGGNIYNNRDDLTTPAESNKGKEVWRSDDGTTWTMIGAHDFIGDAADEKSYADFAVCVFDDGGGDEIWVFGGGRYQHTDATLNGELITETTDIIWHSSDGISWTSEDPTGDWYDFSNGSAVVHNGEIYLIGGYGTGSTNSNLVRKSSDGIDWTEVDSIRRPSESGQNEFLLNCGLWSTGGNLYLYNDQMTWRSTDDGANWLVVSTNISNNISHPGQVVLEGGNMWIHGGLSTGFGYSNQSWKTTDGINWQKINGSPVEYIGNPSPPSGNKQSVSDGSKIWVYTTGYVELDRRENYSVTNTTENEDTSTGQPRDALRYKNSVFSTTDGRTWAYEGYHDLTPSSGDEASDGVDRAPNGHARFYYFNGKIRVLGTMSGTALDAWSTADGLAFDLDEANVSGVSNHINFDICEHEGEIFLSGGLSDSGFLGEGVSNTLYKSSNGETWTGIAGTQHPRIYNHRAISFHDGTAQRMYLIGGVRSAVTNYWVAASITNNAESSWDLNKGDPDGFNFRNGDAVVYGGRLFYVAPQTSAVAESSSLYSTTNGEDWTLEISEDEFMLTHGGESNIVELNNTYYLNVGRSDFSEGGEGPSNFQYYTKNIRDWKIIKELRSRWESRSHAAMYQFDSKVWIHGGVNSDGFLDNSAYWTTDGVTWTEVPQFYHQGAYARFGISNHRIVVMGGELYLIGGLQAAGSSNQVLKSTDGVIWELVGLLPASRSSHSVVVFDDGGGEDLYVIGGIEGLDPTPKSTVFKSANGSSWSNVTQTVPFTARVSHESVVHNPGSGDKIYTIAGSSSGGSVYSSEDGATWTLETSNFGGGSRSNFTAFVTGGRIWVTGGIQLGVSVNTTWSTEDGASWRQDAIPTKYTERHGLVSTVFDFGGGSEFRVFGGADDSSNYLNGNWSSSYTVTAPSFGRTTPSNPKDNDVISWKDVGNNLGVTPAYIEYNGEDEIEGGTSNLDITTNGVDGAMVFKTGKGWRIFRGAT